MAMITCPECGTKISDMSEACIHCGYPLHKENKPSNGTLVIYGYTGFWTAHPKLKIYVNGKYIGDLSYNAKSQEIPITGPTEVEIKCSFRSTLVRVPPDKHSEIHVEFNRVTGNIMAETRSY